MTGQESDTFNDLTQKERAVLKNHYDGKLCCRLRGASLAVNIDFMGVSGMVIAEKAVL